MLAVSVTHHRCDLSLASWVARLLLQPMINEPRSWQVAPRNSGIVSVHGLFPECIFFFFLAEQGQGPNTFACFFLLESQVMGTHACVKRNACAASWVCSHGKWHLRTGHDARQWVMQWDRVRCGRFYRQLR